MAVGFLSPTTYASGLTLVKSQVIGTAVSSVNVTSAFSTTYDNYKIIVSGTVGSTNQFLHMKLGSTSTGYYFSLPYLSYTGVVTGDGGSNTSVFQAGTFDTNICNVNLELFNPFAALPTLYNAAIVDPKTTGRAGHAAGYLANNTSYTDFTLTPAGGTITGGTVFVYGYKQ